MEEMIAQPIPPATPSKSKFLIVVAVLAGLLLIVIIAVFVRRGVSERSERSALEDQIADARRQVAGCTDALCQKAVVEEAAQRVGATEVCGLLQGAARDNCVWLLANDRQDAAYCEQIQDADWRGRCADGLKHASARQADDVNTCYGIADQQRQQACITQLQPELTSTNCLSQGFEEQYCAQVAVMEDAVDMKNPDLCAEVSDEELYDTCLERVGMADRDGDGLDEVQEARYGTSDTNSDSDGDGYTDGEEVDAGYNPSGQGRL